MSKVQEFPTPEQRALTLRLAAEGLAAVASGEFLLASSRTDSYGRLFGRDSLITALQFLSAVQLAPCLAPLLLPPIEGSLRALAALQGIMDDPWMEEEPGKIPHEYNPDGGGDFPGAYYASVDSTPLFLMVLHRYAAVRKASGGGDSQPSPRLRISLPANRDRETLLEEMRDTRDRALAWILDRADLDGDGLIEFLQRNPEGKSLINQNWKDSRDSLLAPDGTMPPYPVAYAEVHAYCYRALREEAELRRGESPAEAERLLNRANRLVDTFERRFWLPQRGYYAQALDGRKRPLADPTSNVAHWLWLGPRRPRRFLRAARRLLDPDLFTPFGVRTLGSSSPNYAPLRYHRGSIWPWDNWVVATSLRRLGMETEARAVDAAVLRAIGLLSCAAEMYTYADGAESPSLEFLDVWGGPARACRTQAWTVGYLVEMLARWGKGSALLSAVQGDRMEPHTAGFAESIGAAGGSRRRLGVEAPPRD